MVRLVVLGGMVAVAAGLLAASWLGVGAWRQPFTDEETRTTEATRKRVEDGRRFQAGAMRGTELVAFQDSLAEVARRDSTLVANRAAQDSMRTARAAISAAAIAAGRPDPYAPVIRNTPSYGGGPSYGK
ncbi:hypothetical protein [Rubrivirga sp.]|uniref:hypothetical protein n=1 Tax=Rubrivirga sp. TaxID=1885344 RepID=UPI003C70ABD1